MNEQRIELTTNEKGLAERNTKRIVGKLKSIIISAPSSIDLVLKIKEFDIPIFKAYSFSGTRYYTVKFRPLSEPGKIEDYFEDYYLDDVLIVQVSGSRNAKIKLILRWESG